jgi:hypothetical protein
MEASAATASAEASVEHAMGTRTAMCRYSSSYASSPSPAAFSAPSVCSALFVSARAREEHAKLSE